VAASHVRRSSGALALVILLAWSAESSAGWIIDQQVKGAGDARQQVMVHSNRMKTTLLEADGKPGAAVIVDLNADTITQINYAERSYVTMPITEYIQAVATMREAAGKHLTQALKNVPPEHRPSVEEAMRQRVGGELSAPQCVEPKVELRTTTQKETIAGFAAVRHDVLLDGKPDLQVWVAKDLKAWSEIDPQKLQQFASQMTRLAACGSGARGLGGDVAWRVASEGYPVRTVDASGTTVEVQKALSRKVSVREFRPPTGYAKKTLADMMRP